jgi:hypothetical protein
MAESETGRWLSTWATDIEPGDKIRRDGDERLVASRNYPPVTQPTFRLEYGTGGESIGKLTKVEIWDPDGSVSRRVMEISARTIR